MELDSAKFFEQLLLAKAFSNYQGIKLSIENSWCCKAFPVILSAQLSKSFFMITLLCKFLRFHLQALSKLNIEISVRPTIEAMDLVVDFKGVKA